MLPLHSTPKAAASGKPYFLFILVAIVAIGSGILVQNSKTPPAELPEFTKMILLPNTKPLVDVDFSDHNGEKFGVEQFKGKWSILFFGFTNCPDVCPTTMQTLQLVKSKLEQAGVWHNYQVIMVSVDPERDTTERLANYVPYFDPEFIGISAPLESTASFAKNLGILFFKSSEADNGSYDVDHGAALILVNPDGQYAGVITAPHVASTISDDLIALAAYAGVETMAVTRESIGTKLRPTTLSADTASEIQSLLFENAWIRPAPPGVSSMAAYFDLRNTTEQDITIDRSSSSAFNMTMIHTTKILNGIASMEHLEQIVVPALGKVRLAPLGTHMMLMGPKHSLALGDKVEITLVAKNGQPFTHTFSVKSPDQ